MSNTKNIVRKPPTKASQAERKKALSEGIAVKWDGREYAVRLGDLSSLDAQALRREVGLSFIGVMKALRTDPDIDLIAAVIWLRRRMDGEPMLPFEAVAAEINYDSDLDIDQAGEETDPEA